MKPLYTSILLSALATALPTAAMAADFDVDDADSLDFESFHEEKDNAVQIWKQGENEWSFKERATKAYADEEKPSSQLQQKTVTSTQQTAAPVTQQVTQKRAKSGDRFEIRQRYTLSRSAATPYSATHVIENLHQQMADICPAGWEKQREWSVPVAQDYYLHYEFECL